MIEIMSPAFQAKTRANGPDAHIWYSESANSWRPLCNRIWQLNIKRHFSNSCWSVEGGVNVCVGGVPIILKPPHTHTHTKTGGEQRQWRQNKKGDFAGVTPISRWDPGGGGEGAPWSKGRNTCVYWRFKTERWRVRGKYTERRQTWHGVRQKAGLLPLFFPFSGKHVWFDSPVSPHPPAEVLTPLLVFFPPPPSAGGRGGCDWADWCLSLSIGPSCTPQKWTL